MACVPIWKSKHIRFKVKFHFRKLRIEICLVTVTLYNFSCAQTLCHCLRWRRHRISSRNKTFLVEPSILFLLAFPWQQCEVGLHRTLDCRGGLDCRWMRQGPLKLSTTSWQYLAPGCRNTVAGNFWYLFDSVRNFVTLFLSSACRSCSLFRTAMGRGTEKTRQRLCPENYWYRIMVILLGHNLEQFHAISFPSSQMGPIATLRFGLGKCRETLFCFIAYRHTALCTDTLYCVLTHCIVYWHTVLCTDTLYCVLTHCIHQFIFVTIYIYWNNNGC
jgi:hypothetical protein